jgi:hypothetical protein
VHNQRDGVASKQLLSAESAPRQWIFFIEIADTATKHSAEMGAGVFSAGLRGF